MYQDISKKINQPIILLGYMGSGKTSIGKKISKILKIKFHDLDKLIENKFNKTLNKIFLDQGEINFRKEERALLENILNKKKIFVLSLGGGTPCYFDNIDFILKKTDLTIFLKPEIKQLSKKLFKKKSKRPIIKDVKTEKKMIEFVSKHLFEREVFYNKANITIDCYKKDIDAICDLIISNLD